MEAITKKLDTLTQSMHMVQHPSPVCTGCGADHITSSCPLASTHMGQSAEVSYAQNYQRQNGSYPYNYHSSLNKHPNYSWVDNPDQNQQAFIHNLENQVGQIATALANKPQGTLPNDTEKNPREQVLVAEAVNYATIELPSTTSTTPVKAYVPPIPFPQRLQRQPTAEQILKEMLAKKRKMPEHETITLPEECSVTIQHRITPKLKDPGGFTLPCSIGNLQGFKFLIDSGASINLIPLPLYRKLGLRDPKAASIILQLVDRTLKHPYGIVEDMLIKTGKFIFPVDFIILDIKEASQIPIILGRPFLSTSWALLDFDTNEIVLRVEDKQQSFTMQNPIKQPSYFEDCQ
ncbi:uncharacterized protein LOC111383246 [Olea europaea var. sylvestris]|uniref:uncharacterized protein LOC111383246 n=1 Tax=Olea europaea var. sylvestris TaxID=158386 RepID=UPI000C1CDA2E|nr:uncharacterized protein LOC111383246 [Olea europaea var. sylvestris]